MPPLTFSHSTSTVPLNCVRSAGVSMTIRVAKSAESAGVTLHRPSGPSSAADLKDDAVPEMKNSSTT
jgi:hypothetical protein